MIEKFEKVGFKMKGNTSRQWPEYWYDEGGDNWTAKPKRFSFGIKFDEEADKARAAVAEHWAEEASKGLYATSRVSDDGMIDPRDTRNIIAMSLSAAFNNKVEGTKEFGTWRM